MRYFVSVWDRHMRDHPNFNSFTSLRKDVFGRRYGGEVFCLGKGDDDHWYYFCPSIDLGRLCEELSEGLPKESTLGVKSAIETNLKPNLREEYKEIMKLLKDRTDPVKV